MTDRQEASKEGGGGSWYYPLLVAAMAEASFKDTGDYITRRQNTVAQYIATRPILDLCGRSFWRSVAWVYWRWWEQECLELEGAEGRAAEESEVE